MNVFADFCRGLLSVIKVNGAPMLYRYPYRTSSEGLRSDWSSIGKDIESTIGRLDSVAQDGQRTDE